MSSHSFRNGLVVGSQLSIERQESHSTSASLPFHCRPRNCVGLLVRCLGIESQSGNNKRGRESLQHPERQAYLRILGREGLPRGSYFCGSRVPEGIDNISL